MREKLTLGDTDFVSVSSVRDYCERGRTLFRPLIGELEVAGAELQAVLREIPGERIGNVDAKVRAYLVANHLWNSSQACTTAVVELVRTYQSLTKHFAVAEQPRRKKTFDLNS